MGSLNWELRVLCSRIFHQIRYAALAPFYYRNPWTMLLTNFRAEPSILCLRDGSVMQVRPHTSDRAAVNDIFLTRPYTDHGRFQIRPDDVVIDAGANIGAFTVFAARRCKRVIAVEPIPENLSALDTNLGLNNLANVTVCRAALSDNDGEIAISGDGMSASTIWGRSSQRVKAMTLATLIENSAIDRVNLLKMDIEGAEFDVLMATPRATLDRIDRIAMEFHTVEPAKRDAPALATFLRSTGSTVHHTSGSWNGLLRAWRERKS